MKKIDIDYKAIAYQYPREVIAFMRSKRLEIEIFVTLLFTIIFLISIFVLLFYVADIYTDSVIREHWLNYDR